MGQRIVVTGATGHIGACLVRQLINHGHHVVAGARNAKESRALLGLDVERADVDVRDVNKLKTVLKRADEIYHLAGRIAINPRHYSELKSINVDGTLNVGEAALHCGVKRVVHVSSIHAFSQAPHNETLNEKRHFVDEHTGHSYASDYDRSKAIGERAIRSFIPKGLDVVVVNPCAIIGPHDYSNSHMGRSLTLMFENKLPVVVAGGFNWVDVRDVAGTLMSAMHSGTTGEGYILAGQWCSISNLVSMARKIVNKKGSSLTLPWHIAKLLASINLRIALWVGNPEPLFTPDSVAALRSNKFISDEKARRELNHNPRPLEDTMRDTHDWWLSQGRITS